jgi:HEPN domain-containing protein
MPADPARLDAAKGWLNKAVEDLRAGSHLLVAEPPLSGPAAFHAQQAAEKSMKALLTWRDVPFRKVHDLGELGRQCAAIDPTLEAVCRRAEGLTVFAWAFRYPGEVEVPLDEAEDALAIARDVYDAVLALVPALES